MPVRSTVLRLPRTTRARLDDLIVERGFAGYADLVAWLEGEGHQVSRSAVQRYGSRLRAEIEPELRRIRIATETAEVLNAELRAGAGVSRQAEAALGLIQHRVYEAVRAGATQEDIEPLGRAAKIAANVARAQTTVSRERRAAKREAANDAAAEAKRQGVSAAGVAAIRAAVEGGPQ